MQSEHAAQQAPSGGIQPPPRTTPTWEAELLLSGAVVFALFQLPAPLHQWALEAIARTGQSGDMLVELGLAYALMVNYSLIGTFLVHLTARGYWAALVGIASVFPGGVRWENYRQGPIAQREMRRQLSDMRQVVERADNFSSLCFAFGLLVAISAALGAVYALSLAVLALLLSELFFDGQYLTQIFYPLLGVLLVPLMLASLIDRMIGKAMGPGAQPEGWLARRITSVYRMRLNTLPAPLMLMLATNLRGRRAYILVTAAISLLLSILMVDILARRNVLSIDGYAFLPAASKGLGTETRHYRALRQQGASLQAPSIEDLVAKGDYLRLVIPYLPERHGELVQRRCTRDRTEADALAADLDKPAAAPARLAAEQRVLECLQRELQLRIDGQPVTADLVFSGDPDTGLRGVLAMVHVHGLARGKHELTIASVPSSRAWDDPQRMEKHQQQGPVRIPFWR